MKSLGRGLLVLVAAGIVVTLGASPSHAKAETPAFDLWPDPDSLPPLVDRLFLPPFPTQAFVDLGFNVKHAGKEWRALQFSRDQSFSASVPPGKYLLGLIGDAWPPHTVDVVDELHRGRLTAVVIDGNVEAVNSSRILDLSTNEEAAAVYNAFPRLLTSGHHTLEYVWEQKQDFFFVIPFNLRGQSDPLGLDGRRVFIHGEVVGDTLDGKLVVRYDLNPACADGLDNDGDGLTDFPTDPGCATPSSSAESPNPACSDGLDNDGDGLVDYPADPDCYAPTDPSETPACSDGLDDDGDGFIDAADSNCASADDRFEGPAPACADGVDNDNNGLIDFPADPGCHSANDDTESPSEPSDPGDARVLVAFAATGSLNGDACSEDLFTGGDGSEECPGDDIACSVCNSPGCSNGIADDSRLYQIKEALRDLFLHTGIELALMRSHQRAGEFECPTSIGTSDAISEQFPTPSGGWQGGDDSFCGGEFDVGDLLVSFAPDNFWSLWRYADGSSNKSEPGSPQPGHDFELRGTGSRHMAALLASAKEFLDRARTEDAVVSCRSYDVFLVVDGGFECGGDPVAAAFALSASGIRVHVLGYAIGLDLASRVPLNAIATAGGTGAALFVDNEQDLLRTLDLIADSIRLEQVHLELCNGLDDNCNGLVDEGFTGLGQSCDNGQLGRCFRTGVRVCAPDGLGTECALAAGEPWIPVPETCNGLDDDCDGFTDEEGVCGTAELCNGLDDDGDGLVDEDFPVGAPCSDGGVGVCRGTGTLQCLPDHSGVYCNITQPGLPPAPSDTTCDGKDDDCDGSLDEDAVGEMVTIGSFRIDRYEASRPDATETDEGRMEHRPCSKPHVLPWRGVTWSEADELCAAVGKRLCTDQEWQSACEGPTRLVYPYGDFFSPAACNGKDYDPDDDGLLPTGSLASCVSASGVRDMSGNLKEWTSAETSPIEHSVRGGAYDDQAPALTCQFESDEQSLVVLPNLGFRCCSTVP